MVDSISGFASMAMVMHSSSVRGFVSCAVHQTLHDKSNARERTGLLVLITDLVEFKRERRNTICRKKLRNEKLDERWSAGRGVVEHDLLKVGALGDR
jgi:hypothetical protein